MTTTKKTHGGAGRNQGRKPIASEPLAAVIQVRCSEDQKAKATRLGEGNPGAWVRKKIDQAKEPT